MALLSNINDKFAVDSTGAIQFNGQVGTSGYVLKSNANAAPTWVDPSTVIGGPYLPLSGGTLTGATATASGISFTVGGTLTGTNATFSSDVFSDGLYVNSTTAVSGTQVAIVQDGAQNLQRWGTANSGQASYRFRIDQDMKFIANSGSGDNLIIYSDTGNIEGTTATFSGLVSGITPTAAANFATKAYVDAHPGSGGTVTGTGAANRVTYWSSATNVTSDAGFTYNGAGRVNTDESFGVSKDGADTVADGPFFRLTNAAETRQYLWQLDASNNIDYWYYNGTAWTQTISLLNNGGATFAGNVTAGYGFFNAESLTEDLRVGGIYGNLGLYIPDTYDMQFSVATTASKWKFTLANIEKFVITPNGDITANGGGTFGGNVGIGTTSPDSKLNINGASAHLNFTGSNNRINFSGYRAIEGSHTGSLLQIGESYSNISLYGNVGIGTTSPITKLEVASSTSNSSIRTGGLEMQSYAVNNSWYSENLYYDGGGWRLRSAGFATQMYMGAGTINFVRFPTAAAGTYVSPSSTMFLDSNGHVGIGTTSPTEKLDVVEAIRIQAQSGGTNNATLVLTARNGGAYGNSLIARSDIQSTTDGTAYGSDLLFKTTDSSNTRAERMRIKSNGNVGIGTTSPNAKLMVIGNIGLGDGTYNGGVYANNSSTTVDSNWGLEIQKTSGVTDWNTRLKYYPTSGNSRKAGIFDSRNNRFSLYSDTNDNPNIIIAYGNVGIGTPSPIYRLHVVSSNNVSIFEDTSNASGAAFIVFNRPGVFSMGSITRNGSANSVSYNTGSDYRLKEDLKDFNALDLVNNITAYDYKWKDVDQRDYGFIAHELSQTLPNVVTGEKDGEKMQGVDYSKLTPILLKAIQELEARVKELENK